MNLIRFLKYILGINLRCHVKQQFSLFPIPFIDKRIKLEHIVGRKMLDIRTAKDLYRTRLDDRLLCYINNYKEIMCDGLTPNLCIFFLKTATFGEF